MDVKRVERKIKGAANHHRLRILLQLNNHSLSLFEITKNLKINYTTVSEHTRKMVDAGLINKKYKGQIVEHSLTPLGKDILKFCKKL